jgi:hypothetical protein
MSYLNLLGLFLLGFLVVGIIETWQFCTHNKINLHDDEQDVQQ